VAYQIIIELAHFILFTHINFGNESFQQINFSGHQPLTRDLENLMNLL